MRVVGGNFRGRTIAAPKTQLIRPTVDRLRESLFNILTHAYGDPVSGAACARSLRRYPVRLASRRCHVARHLPLFVDDGAEARALAAAGERRLRLDLVAPPARVFRRDATRLGPAYPVEPFSLAFLDPPYGKQLAEGALMSARDGAWFMPEALVVVEEAVKSAFATPEGFAELGAAALRTTRSSWCCGSSLPP